MTDTTDQPPPLRVAYIGNFEPEHSTESHIARAWRNNGHRLYQSQEQHAVNWTDLIVQLRSASPPDLVMWTSTAGLAQQVPQELQREMLATALHQGIPTVGYHLDRWWGLDRSTRITQEHAPFFEVEMLVTADGGHQPEWEAAGINHLWMPPGVSRDEALLEPSRRADRYARFDVAFVGSWRSYHPEWAQYRLDLISKLQEWYGARLLLVDGGLRGQGLVDLYRTVPVIVGDSCLAPNARGGPMTHYWSDRIPETLGRGGALIHPFVVPIDNAFNPTATQYRGPWLYPLGDFEALHHTIEGLLANDHSWVEPARQLVLAEHTYERRMEQLVVEMQARKMLPEVMA